MDACLGKPWQELMITDYNREKFYWGLLRIAVKARYQGDNKTWVLLRDELQAFMRGREFSDSFTRLEYADELGFLSYDATNGFPQSIDSTKPSTSPMKSAVGDAQVDMAH
jgi:hypothetical protein